MCIAKHFIAVVSLHKAWFIPAETQMQSRFKCMKGRHSSWQTCPLRSKDSCRILIVCQCKCYLQLKTPEELEVVRYTNMIASSAHVEVIDICAFAHLDRRASKIIDFADLLEARACFQTCIRELAPESKAFASVCIPIYKLWLSLKKSLCMLNNICTKVPACPHWQFWNFWTIDGPSNIVHRMDCPQIIFPRLGRAGNDASTLHSVISIEAFRQKKIMPTLRK